jgi:hypothetical protein
MHSKDSLACNKIVHLLAYEGERWILISFPVTTQFNNSLQEIPI